MVAKIAVSSAVFAIDKPYSYRIPAPMPVLPGQRVMVPFGRGNRRAEGIVLSVEEGPEEGLKAVDRVLDSEPVLSGDMLRLAAFMRQRYFCTFYDAVRAMLPAGLWFRVKDSYTLSVSTEEALEKVKRNSEAGAVILAVAELGGQASYQALRKTFSDESTLQEALRYLLKKGIFTSDTDFLRKVGDKTEYVVTLASSPEEARSYAAQKARSAPMQTEVLRLMTSIGSAGAKEVLYFTGASMATLKRLESLGFLSLTVHEVMRRVAAEPTVPAGPVVLTRGQQAVFDALAERLARPEKKPALLYGVTGSGKTSVYIQLIRKCLEDGKSAILLVPEIALTPQLMGLMTAHFGDRVAVLHSSLRVGERYDEWKRIRQGSASVILGTRSAVFAPAVNPGIIILDEEQEHTYKSENNPRYHAREVAIWRGSRENALVLLGSATPSVESMYHGRQGDYDLFTLQERYNGRSLPHAELADMRRELQNGNSGCISGPLLGRLEECAARGHQSILFLNRRGSSRFLICVDCGDVPQCPRCSVSLTYHGANRRLMCHYCGFSVPSGDTCGVCGGHRKPVGAGTQKAEEELREKLPGTEVLRMDADTVSAVNNHRAILKKFKDEDIPVLLGTQMVAKGLDFENVTLVGVLDADQSLYVDNFRASETTFSMIAQVIGRAGRGREEGRALIQTMTPEHKVIRLAAQQDYDGFYRQEIQVRQARNLPPFADLISIRFTGLSEQLLIQASTSYRRWLEDSLKRGEFVGTEVGILGPVPAPVMKINNRYHYRLTVCCRSTRQIRELIAHLMREMMKNQKFRDVSVFADCNPCE